MPGENLKKMLSAVLGPFQVAEDAMMAMLVQRRVGSAEGVSLDVLGRIVGEPRQGREDDDYRRYVRARVAANNSDGTYEDHINVAKLVLDESGAYIHVKQIGTGAIAVVIEDVVVDTPLASIVLAFAQDAASAGVRVVVEYWPVAETGLFTFSAFPGEVQLGKGFGTFADPDDGGAFAGGIG